MIYQVYMPKFGANIETGVIRKWYKKEGDRVEKGEIIAAIETIKAIFELEAEESGILRKIFVPEDKEMPFNNIIALIADGDENIESVLASIENRTVDVSTDFVKAMDESVFDKSRESGKIIARKMTPSARRLMREHGISDEALNIFQKEVLEDADILSLIHARKVLIYGASTGAKQIIEIIRSRGKYNVIGIVDDNRDRWGKSVEAFVVMGDFEWLKKSFEKMPDISVMISSHSTNREKIFRRIKDNIPTMELPPIIDSRAVLLSGVTVGESSLIEAGVILGHEVAIGRNVILNLGVKMSHNCTVRDHSHIAIGASISAAVIIGENVFIGAGVAVNPAVTIGRNSVISPNTAVLHDIPEDVIVSGAPGKIVGESKRGKQ